MIEEKKEGRYARIYEQLKQLLAATANTDARMATIVAVLHHKMDYYFWTGFYCLDNGELIVKTYQGPVACQVLEKDTGVCWAGINRKTTIVVPNVHDFPGHIACDARSSSEIVVPLRSASDEVTGVLDVDSKDFNAFDQTDARWLEKILALMLS